MRVKVLSYSGFRQILGRERDLDLEKGSTIGDLLRRLCDAHADLKIRLFEGNGLRPDVFIMLNGRSIGSLGEGLSEGDEVAVFTAAIGG